MRKDGTCLEMSRGLRRRHAKAGLLLRWLALGIPLAVSPGAWALDLNMPHGVTPISHDAYDLHMMAFWIMLGIAVIVFGAIFWSVIFHRRSRGHEAAKFHENLKFEIAWTILPCLILLGMAIPASIVLLKDQDFHGAQLKIKVTGYQWLWHYQYLNDAAKPVYGFYSRLAVASEERMGLDAPDSPWTDKHYLLQVDHPLVVPTHEKILLLITSGDVIHSWWVPDFGEKQDAIPGFVNQMWIDVEKPGVYRGQCAQLCGGGHAYMPIVVIAKPKAQFESWLKSQEAAAQGTSAAAARTQVPESSQGGGMHVAVAADGGSE